MSDSAGNLPKPNPAANGEGGGIAPEDADRFASSFVPSWQFEEAPFTAGAMNAADLHELGAPSSNVVSDRTLVDNSPPSAAANVQWNAQVAKIGETNEEMTAADVDVSALIEQTKPPSATQPSAQLSADPFASRHATVMGLAQPPPPPAAPTLQPIVQPQQQAPAQQAPFVQQAPVQRTQLAVRPAAANGFVARPSFGRPSPDDSVSLPVRKSNTGLVVGGLVAVLGVVGFLGIHFMKSEPPPAAQHVESVASKPTATEAPIPPPPPATETAAAPPHPAETAAAAPPAALTVPKPLAATPSPPPPRQATPPRQSSRDALSRPAASPKSATRSGSGGIVRDNPF